MSPEARAIAFPNEAKKLLSASRASEGLHAEGAFKAAIEAARDACHQQLAQLFYSMALAYFAQAEKRNGEVFVRGDVESPDAITPRISRMESVSRSLGTEGVGEAEILRLASAPAFGGSYRARSRRWCRAAIDTSNGHHIGALELLAAHLILDGQQVSAIAVYNFIAKESRSARQRGFALANCGKALLDLGRPQDAAAACERAMRSSSEDGLALANLAVSRLLIRDVRGALRAYTNLARRAGEDLDLGEKLPRLLSSDIAFARRHVGIPVQDFQVMWKELQSLGLVSRKGKSPTPSVETGP